MFWPVFIPDSINGYDFIAKAIIREGTFNNAVFDTEYPLYSARSSYPPLVPLSFSMAYMMGHESSKIIVAVFYVCTFVVSYSFFKRYSTHFAAALFSLLLVITPEFAAFSALSSPNPMCTFYTAAGILSLYVWYKEDNKSYLLLGTICIILALWTRTEALIFFLGGGSLVLLKTIKTRNYILMALFGAACLSVFVFWQLYVKSVLAVESANPIIAELYWDPGKLSRMWEKVKDVTFNTQYYGIVVYLFIVMVLINIGSFIKDRERLVFIGVILISWLSYLLIYYQLDSDYSQGSPNWIESGYKRGLFYFLPLLLFYCANNKIMSKVFNDYLKIN